jgi:hypothetical protein
LTSSRALMEVVSKLLEQRYMGPLNFDIHSFHLVPHFEEFMF